MLRKRVVTVLTFNDGVLYRTKLFRPDYRYTLNFVDAWSVDEIVVLDVTRPGEGSKENFYQTIQNFASNCFVPMAAGGGIRNKEDVKKFLSLGADKVIINSGAIDRPDLINEIAELYGSQCVILSIDAKKNNKGVNEVFSNFALSSTGRDPTEWAKEGEDRGAGEILITSIDRDGWLQGYDIELCKSVTEAVNVPVLIMGGAGNWKHFLDGFEKGGASAVCTQNIYHFTESSVKSAKVYLRKAGIDVRI